MKFYHATPRKNLDSILANGLKVHCGGVYLCEKPEDALKFAYVYKQYDVVVFEVNIRKNDKYLVESFDHSFEYFKCRCWCYVNDIPPSMLTNNIVAYSV